MAFTSIGYDGTVNERQWAELVPSAGSSIYGVKGAGDLKVTAVAGQPLTLSVAPGSGWGHGVLDTQTANTTIACEAIGGGSRWDLIALRRDWQPLAGGPTSVVAITGSTDKVLPGSREVTPGVIDDQPLALVQWTYGQTQPSLIVDLRCWAGNGGLVANDPLVRTFINSPGTRISIQGVDWVRRLGANDVEEWFRASVLTADYAGSTKPEAKAGIVTVAVDGNGACATTFPEPFAQRILGAVPTQVTSPNLGPVKLIYDEGLSNASRAAFFVYDKNDALVRNATGLRISYIAWGD